MKNIKEEPKDIAVSKKAQVNSRTRRFTAKNKSIAETPLNIEKKFPSISTNDVDQNAIISQNEQEDITKVKVESTKTSKKKRAVKKSGNKKNNTSPRKRQKVSEKGEALKKEKLIPQNNLANMNFVKNGAI